MCPEEHFEDKCFSFWKIFKLPSLSDIEQITLRLLAQKKGSVVKGAFYVYKRTIAGLQKNSELWTYFDELFFSANAVGKLPIKDFSFECFIFACHIMNILPEKKEVTRFCEKDDFDFFNIASKNAKKKYDIFKPSSNLQRHLPDFEKLVANIHPITVY